MNDFTDTKHCIERKNKVTPINEGRMTKQQKNLSHDPIFLDLLQCGDMFFEARNENNPLFAFEKDFKARLCEKYGCTRGKIDYRLRAAVEAELLFHYSISVYEVNPEFLLWSIDKSNQLCYTDKVIYAPCIFGPFSSFCSTSIPSSLC